VSEPDFSKAIPAGSVEAEYAHIRTTICACGGPHAGQKQTLLRDPAGRHYDQIEAVCAKCGAPRTFLFDISSFFGNRVQAPPPSSNRGCLILAGVFAAAVAAGIVLLVMNDKGPLAALLGLIAGLAIVLSKPWKPVTPEELQALVPPGGSSPDEKMVSALRALGIPLETGATTPEEALLGGQSKLAIARGVHALAERRWDEAAASLGSAIRILSRAPSARWNPVVAVAHRLRAQAHEGAGRRAEALADYESALAAAPDDAESQAGKKRLSSP
jgi:hypothetical protein